MLTLTSEAIAAVTSGNAPQLAALLDGDPGLARARDADGCPALLIAALHGYNARSTRNKAVVDLLLQRGAVADIFAAAYLDRPAHAARLLSRDPALARAAVQGGAEDGWTPLHYAAERGATEVARLLLYHGADPNAASARGGRPVALAAHPGPWKAGPALELIRLLAQHGAEIDVLLAAALGDTVRLRALLAADPSQLDRTDADGAGPLFHAAQHLRQEAVRLLLRRGADVNARRTDGQTPVSTAVGHMEELGGPEVVQLLLEAGAVLDLYEACKLGKKERAAEILKRDPDQLTTARGDETPIEAAAHQGHAELGRMLYAAGAPLTPATAAALGLAEQLRELLARDPEACSAPEPRCGYTPLHRAAQAGQPESIRILLECGAPVNSRTASGATPLFLATAAGGRGPRPSDLAVMELLLGWGADPNAVESRRGFTPLHAAAVTGHEEAARALLASGADPTLCDRYGCTPDELAQKRGHPEIAELIRHATGRS